MGRSVRQAALMLCAMEKSGNQKTSLARSIHLGNDVEHTAGSLTLPKPGEGKLP